MGGGNSPRPAVQPGAAYPSRGPGGGDAAAPCTGAGASPAGGKSSRPPARGSPAAGRPSAAFDILSVSAVASAESPAAGRPALGLPALCSFEVMRRRGGRPPPVRPAFERGGDLLLSFAAFCAALRGPERPPGRPPTRRPFSAWASAAAPGRPPPRAALFGPAGRPPRRVRRPAAAPAPLSSAGGASPRRGRAAQGPRPDGGVLAVRRTCSGARRRRGGRAPPRSWPLH